jgi:membrane dipeptidase
MILVDGHLDIALNGVVWNRDLKKDAIAIRVDEQGMTQKGRARGTLGFPDLRAAEVAVSLVTVLARVKPRSGEPSIDYCTHEAAYAHAQGELAYYREMERQGVLRMIKDAATLDAHMEQWKADSGSCPLGIILTMEGADPIVEPETVHGWWDDGLRALSLAHYGPSKYAFGTASVGPVTPDGLALLDEMSKGKMILDVTHLCDESFWMAVERFQGPLIATHSNCRTLVPGDRQFDDDQLKLLFERGAVIGTALDSWMLYPGWIRGETQPEVVGLEAVAEQIDYVCQLAGNTKHAAIGTDLDGGYGTEQTPRDLKTYRDMQKIPDLLRAKGYSEADIEAIFHGNWLNLFRRVWSA